MISLDWSLAVSALVFLITLAALNRILFKPLLAVLEERRAKTAGAIEIASQEGDRYHTLVAEYQKRLKEERQAGYREAEELRSQALTTRQEQLSQARQQAQEKVEKAKEQIQAEVQTARNQLRTESEEIAALITKRVLEKA